MEIFEIATQIFYILLGAAIATGTSFWAWKSQLNFSRKNIAYALLYEISQIEKPLQGIAEEFKKDDGNSMIIVPQRIYTENGLYYVFQKDISDFDKKLSNMLYDFYYNLMIAEQERCVINKIKEEHWADISEEEIPDLHKKLELYKESLNGCTIQTDVPYKIQMKYVGLQASFKMKESIIRSTKLIPTLKLMLSKECNYSVSKT